MSPVSELVVRVVVEIVVFVAKNSTRIVPWLLVHVRTLLDRVR